MFRLSKLLVKHTRNPAIFLSSCVNPIQFPLFGNIDTRSNIVDIRIVGDGYRVIQPLVNQIMEIGNDIKGIAFRHTDLALRKPEVQVRVDPERAANLGFQSKDIADAVEAAGGGQQTTTQYDVAGRYFYIMVMGQESEVKTVGDVDRIVLTSPLNPNIQIPLTSVASVETVFGPLQIGHYNSKRALPLFSSQYRGGRCPKCFRTLSPK